MAVEGLLHQAGRPPRPAGARAEGTHVLVHQRFLRQSRQRPRHHTQTHQGKKGTTVSHPRCQWTVEWTVLADLHYFSTLTLTWIPNAKKWRS